MNTELRNKILNRYRESAEQENTQELEAFQQARDHVEMIYNFIYANKISFSNNTICKGVGGLPEKIHQAD